jgi:hypothetical protein
MTKLKEKRSVSEEGRVRELVCLKMMLDLKVAFLLASEHPRLKVLIKHTLPLTIKLHRELLTSSSARALNEEYEKIRWSRLK